MAIADVPEPFKVESSVGKLKQDLHYVEFGIVPLMILPWLFLFYEFGSSSTKIRNPLFQ